MKFKIKIKFSEGTKVMKFLYVTALITSLFAMSDVAFSQCSTCTYTVATSGGGNYNVNSGQTLCIKSCVVFTGTIELNGGTVCNNGTINSGSGNFNSGKFYNYGTFTRSGGFNFGGEFYNSGTLTLSGDLNINNPNGKFYNYSGATLNVGGNVSNNAVFSNQGTATVNGSYHANGGSQINENTGTMTVKGNLQLNALFNNSGPLTVNGSVAVNGNATLTNAPNTRIKVGGDYQNNGTTINSGTIEVTGNFTNNGGGVYTNNYGTSIFGNFMNNGTINGDNVGCNTFTVSGNNVVQNGGGSMSNNDFCAYRFPGSNFSTNNGSTGNTTYCTCSNTVTPLPIVLTAFAATCDAGDVRIDWTTATEINNSFFTIWRSNDAANWETVTAVQGAGNSNQTLNYTYTDARPLDGVSYYRIQQTDYDGKSETFAPVGVSCGAKTAEPEWSVYPNPTTDILKIAVVSNTAESNVPVVFYDMNGKACLLQNVQMNPGANEWAVDCTALTPGTYFVHVKSNGTTLKPLKLVVSNRF